MMIMYCVFLQDGETALHCAAGGGNVDVVQIVLQNQPDLILKTDDVSNQCL